MAVNVPSEWKDHFHDEKSCNSIVSAYALTDCSRDSLKDESQRELQMLVSGTPWFDVIAEDLITSVGQFSETMEHNFLQ